MWEDDVFESIGLAAAALGADYHRATVGVSGALLSICFRNASGEVLGRYLVSAQGEVVEA